MRISNRAFVLLIAGIVILALIAGSVVWLNLRGSVTVKVTVDGKLYGTYDLTHDQTVVIRTDDGSWYNILRIEDGYVCVIEADCDNQICVHTPALSRDFPGVIACLPHGLVVELTG